MVDRTKFPAAGLQKGKSGSTGTLEVNDKEAIPKTILWLEPNDTIKMSPPGGGGFGTPWERDPQHVLLDVIEGYVTIEAAKLEYGVIISCSARHDQLVRLPDCYHLDLEATAQFREANSPT